MIIKYKKILFYCVFLFALHVCGMEHNSNGPQKEGVQILTNAKKLKALIEKQKTPNEFTMSATVKRDEKNLTQTSYDIDELWRMEVSLWEGEALGEIRSAIINCFFETLVSKEHKLELESLVKYLEGPYMNDYENTKEGVLPLGAIAWIDGATVSGINNRRSITFNNSFLKDFLAIEKYLNTLTKEKKQNFITKAQGILEKAQEKAIKEIDAINNTGEAILTIYQAKILFSGIMHKAFDCILVYPKAIGEWISERKKSKNINSKDFIFNSIAQAFNIEELILKN